MTTAPHDAIRLLGLYTAGRYDIYALAGAPRASCRAHVMSALVGHKVPQSAAGVNALRAAFYALVGVTGDCEAHRERQFIARCVELGAGAAR